MKKEVYDIIHFEGVTYTLHGTLTEHYNYHDEFGCKEDASEFEATEAEDEYGTVHTSKLLLEQLESQIDYLKEL